MRDSEVAKQINENRYHPKYLTDCKIPETTWATADPKEALMDVDYIVHAVPMQQSRNFPLVSKRSFASRCAHIKCNEGC